MNALPPDEEQLLREAARDFLSKECPSGAVRAASESAAGFDPALWKQMAALGWLGLALPEAWGGAGFSFRELVLILEEAGRAALPSPWWGHLQGTLAVLRAGSPAQREQWLPAAAAGERILTVAVTERAGTEESRDLALRADGRGSELSLTGAKYFVPYAASADWILVLARRPEGAFCWAGVRAGAPGLRLTPLDSMDATRRLSQLEFAATPAELLGEADSEVDAWPVWEWLRDRALVALAADSLGGALRCAEDSVAYAKEREQFGRPIGFNQAIKHKCADLLVATETLRALTHYAGRCAAEEDAGAPLAAAMAKACAGDVYARAAAEAIQIHGGVGFTWEYDCHIYYKRARANEVTYGSPAVHRERVARLECL